MKIQKLIEDLHNYRGLLVTDVINQNKSKKDLCFICKLIIDKGREGGKFCSGHRKESIFTHISKVISARQLTLFL